MLMIDDCVSCMCVDDRVYVDDYVCVLSDFLHTD